MLTTKDSKQIKLVFLAGMNDQGKPIYKSRIYKNVNVANATLDNVHAFGQAMAALSQWPLDQIILSTDAEIFDIIA